MAISKERLKELIEQDKVFYWVFNKEIRMLCNLSVPTYWKKNWELYGKDCFENREDAEFVAKYHTSRVEKFEPPTYEEFKQGKFYHFISKDCFYSLSPNLVHDEVVIYECVHGGGYFIVYKQPLTKENYYKAVEIARKLFLGEEDA